MRRRTPRSWAEAEPKAIEIETESVACGKKMPQTAPPSATAGPASRSRRPSARFSKAVARRGTTPTRCGEETAPRVRPGTGDMVDAVRHQAALYSVNMPFRPFGCRRELVEAAAASAAQDVSRTAQ
ncbi:hypothetical protein GCM10010272_52490 [Streptomyces lateritius]|nr:hypothetical protein GCM10010272_52490 [Streptomyces lateritius]